MCGIVGYTGTRPVKDILIEGLSRLEYRGYDSAGIAVEQDGKLEVVHCKGKVSGLAQLVEPLELTGTCGIGHTRWATHGRPSEANAHPHTSCDGSVAVVHNGIIENFAELREELEGRGHTFTSQTDTEVIAHLVEENLRESNDLLQAVREAADRLIGAVAGVLSILCARTSLASQLFYPAYEGGRLADDGRLVMYQLVRWAACFAILLIAATIIAFGRQMVRAERSHLIRALSHCMTGAVVSVSAAGWCFVPDLIDMGSASPDNGLLTRFIIVAAAFVVVAVLFAVCSVSWSREADPDPAAPAPWLGIGLLPVMLSGLLVFAASFVMQLIF